MLAPCWWEREVGQLLWETVWSCPKELNMKRPQDLAVPLLGIYPREPKAETQRDVCTNVINGSIIHRSQKVEATQMSPDR